MPMPFAIAVPFSLIVWALDSKEIRIANREMSKIHAYHDLKIVLILNYVIYNLNKHELIIKDEAFSSIDDI